MMGTLSVKYDPARMQYTAHCPDCKTTVATWTYEWCVQRLVTPPIGWDHDCPELTTTATINPVTYEPPAIKENETS